MTIAYFDSSALVKLVVEESGSEDAAQLWDGADSVITSRVAHSEVRAALAAAQRAARLEAQSYEQARTDWDEFHQALRLVGVTHGVELAAGGMAEQHALSGFDAIHLASALAISAAPLVMATWDARLHRAARAAGLATLPAQL